MSNLRAALALTFQEQVSPGLNRLQKGLEDLKRSGRDVRLVGLDNADRTLRGASEGASFLARSLGLVGAAADRATNAIQRVGHAVRQFGNRGFGPGSAVGAFAGAASGYTMATQLESWSKHSDLLRTGSIISGNYGPDADKFMKEWGTYFNRLALRTGQRSTKLADTGAWMAFNSITPDQIRTTLPGMAEIATTYKADVKDVARVSEGLMFNLKVKPEDIKRALVVMAQLSKEGGFQFSDQAIHFPKVAATGALVGMTGMGAVEELASAMQILLKAGSDREPGTAAVQLQDFLIKLDMEDTRKKFMEKWGIDIRKTLFHGVKMGRSPLVAGLAKIQEIQAYEVKKAGARDPLEVANVQGNVIKDLFGDKEAKAGADVKLKNVADFIRIMSVAKKVEIAALDRDFAERARDDAFALEGLQERMEQAGRRLGKEFAPAVRSANGALDSLGEVIERMDEQYPGIIGKTVLATGAFLAFGAGLAVLGAAAPLIAGGLGVVLALIGTIATPIGAVVVGIGALIAAAVLMRDELTQGFDLMLAGARDTWDAIKGLGAAVGDLVTSKLAALADWAAPRLMEVLDGLKRDWVAITENVTHLFRLMDDFTGGNLTRVFEGIRDMVDSLGKWTGDGLLRALEGVRDRVLAVFQPLRDLLDSLTSWLPGSEAAPGSTRERLGTMPPGFVPMGFTGGIPLGTGAAGITTIYVRAEPGTVVTRVEGGQAGVQVNPGPTTVRI